MIGTFANAGTILVGSLIGGLLKKSVKIEYQNALYTALGLVALGLGVNAIVTNMPNSQYPVLFIISLSVGSLCGTVLDLSGRFDRLVGRFSKTNLGQGLSTGIILFCIGALSIMGPVLSALYGDNTYLFTNATLDLVTSMVLASTYGIGMCLAAPVLFCWQGMIYFVAKYVSGTFFSDDLVTELCIVGGFLIMASGFSILKIKDCQTMNMLPALVIPILFFFLRNVFF